MSAQGGTKQRRRWPLLRRQGALIVALMAGAGTLFAAVPISQSFRVTVALSSPAASSTAQCGTSAEPGLGRKVNVVCLPAPPTGEALRYLLHVYSAGEWLGTVEGEMGAGTVTSWRIVHMANREYLEMMVGW